MTKPEVEAAVAEAEVLSATAEVLVPLKRKKAMPRRAGKTHEERADRIESVERELYERNLRVLLDASYFGEAADLSVVPQPWVEELGPEEATRRFTIAKHAIMSAKEAPTGLGVAKYIVGAFAKAKAQSGRAPTLNVNLISFVQGPKMLPTIDIEETK